MTFQQRFCRVTSRYVAPVLSLFLFTYRADTFADWNHAIAYFVCLTCLTMMFYTYARILAEERVVDARRAWEEEKK